MLSQYDNRLNVKTSTRKSAKPHTRTSATRYVTRVTGVDDEDDYDDEEDIVVVVDDVVDVDDVGCKTTYKDVCHKVCDWC